LLTLKRGIKSAGKSTFSRSEARKRMEVAVV
jgi:hypothetical protein